MGVRKGSGLDFQHGDMSKIKALTPSSITIKILGQEFGGGMPRLYELAGWKTRPPLNSS